MWLTAFKEEQQELESKPEPNDRNIKGRARSRHHKTRQQLRKVRPTTSSAIEVEEREKVFSDDSCEHHCDNVLRVNSTEHENVITPPAVERLRINSEEPESDCNELQGIDESPAMDELPIDEPPTIGNILAKDESLAVSECPHTDESTIIDALPAMEMPSSVDVLPCDISSDPPNEETHDAQSTASIIVQMHDVQSTASIVVQTDDVQSTASIVVQTHDVQSTTSIVVQTHDVQSTSSIVVHSHDMSTNQVCGLPTNMTCDQSHDQPHGVSTYMPVDVSDVVVCKSDDSDGDDEIVLRALSHRKRRVPHISSDEELSDESSNETVSLLQESLMKFSQALSQDSLE